MKCEAENMTVQVATKIANGNSGTFSPSAKREKNLRPGFPWIMATKISIHGAPRGGESFTGMWPWGDGSGV